MTVSSEYLNQAGGNVKADAVPARKPYNRKLLRIVSVVFAITLALFLVGLGGRIYMDRVVNGLVNESSVQLTDQHRGVLTEWLSGVVREDATAVHFAEVDMEKLNANYSYGPDGTYIVTEPDPEKTYDYSLAEKPKYKGKTKASYYDSLADLNRNARGIYGLKWNVLFVSGFSATFMWVGGILAAAALIVWLASGGRWSNRSDTAVVPATAILAVIGILFIIVCCFVPADFTQHLRIAVENAGLKMVR